MIRVSSCGALAFFLFFGVFRLSEIIGLLGFLERLRDPRRKFGLLPSCISLSLGISSQGFFLIALSVLLSQTGRVFCMAS